VVYNAGTLQKLTSHPHPYLLQFMSNLNCNTMKNEEKITLSEAENKRLNELRMKEHYARLWLQQQIWLEEEEG